MDKLFAEDECLLINLSVSFIELIFAVINLASLTIQNFPKSFELLCLTPDVYVDLKQKLRVRGISIFPSSLSSVISFEKHSNERFTNSHHRLSIFKSK